MLFLLFYPHLLSAYHVPKPLLSNYIHYLIYSSQLWMIIILLLLQMRKWILICTLGNLCRITKLIYGRVGTQTSKDMFAATLRYYRISLPKSLTSFLEASRMFWMFAESPLTVPGIHQFLPLCGHGCAKNPMLWCCWLCSRGMKLPCWNHPH